MAQERPSSTGTVDAAGHHHGLSSFIRGFHGVRYQVGDVSRAVAQNAASQSGLAPDLLKKMLPMLAMLVTGYMAKQQGGGAPAETSGIGAGGLGGLLGGLLGGQSGASATNSASAPGLGSMLDLNGDGNPLDDILRMARR